MSYIQVCSVRLILFSLQSNTISPKAPVKPHNTLQQSHSFEALSFALQLNTFITHTEKNVRKKLCKKKILTTKHSPIFCWIWRWLQMGCYSVLFTEHIWLHAQSQTEFQTLNLIHVFGNLEPLGSLWCLLDFKDLYPPDWHWSIQTTFIGSLCLAIEWPPLYSVPSGE